MNSVEPELAHYYKTSLKIPRSKIGLTIYNGELYLLLYISTGNLLLHSTWAARSKHLIITNLKYKIGNEYIKPSFADFENFQRVMGDKIVNIKYFVS